MQQRVLEEIKKKVIPILKKANVKKAALFGSYVRGDNTQKSDVDILVDLPRGKSLFTSRTNDPWYKSSEVEFAKGDDLVFRRIRSNGKEDPRTNVKS